MTDSPLSDDRWNDWKRHSPAPWTLKTWQVGPEYSVHDANNVEITDNPDISQSDAALIAAAPEMLELLKGLASLTSDLAPYWQNKVVEVIAKAEGNGV